MIRPISESDKERVLSFVKIKKIAAIAAVGLCIIGGILCGIFVSKTAFLGGLFLAASIAFFMFLEKPKYNPETYHYIKARCMDQSYRGYRNQYNEYLFKIKYFDDEKVKDNPASENNDEEPTKIRMRGFFGNTKQVVDFDKDQNILLKTASKKFKPGHDYLMCFSFINLSGETDEDNKLTIQHLIYSSEI